MLMVSNLRKQFARADSPILKDITFTVNSGERVGVIGPNGAGKSTLLDIIAGRTAPDSGGISFNPPDVRVGYLAQGLTVPDDTRVYDVLFPQSAAVNQAEAEVALLGEALANAADSQLNALMHDYDTALEQLDSLGYDIDTAAGEKMLAAVGLDDVSLDTSVGELSGGQKTRLSLAAILLDKPQLLVLDEPTNHLNVRALEWLEDWLNAFSGGVLIVSHDRAFLDRVVNRIVALDPETATARVFVGSYSDYIDTLASERDKQWSQWRDQQVEIARLQHDMERTMARAVRKENATVNDRQRRYAKKVAKRAKSKETRLNRYLDSDERVDKPTRTWDMKIDFDKLPEAHGFPVRLNEVCVGYDVPLLTDLTLTVAAGERVAIMGPNGHGKSTLLKTIGGEIAPLDGTIRIGAGVQLGYLAQEQDILDLNSTPLETLQDSARMLHGEARSFLHYYLFTQDEVFRPIAQLSYGERARLMLALIVAQGANVLLLDEPLNHLDLSAREKFEAALTAFPGSVLAVAHDRYFVERFATTIWHIEDGALHIDYQETVFD